MRTNLLNNLSKGMNFSLTRIWERVYNRYAATLLVVLMVGVGQMWGETLSFDVTGPTNKSLTQNNITVSSSNNIQDKSSSHTGWSKVWKIDSNPISITSTSANICKVTFTACYNSSGTSVAQSCKVSVSTDGSTYTTLSSGVTVSGGGTGTSSTNSAKIYISGYGGDNTVTVTFTSSNYRYVRIEKDGKETWVNSIKVYTGSSARTYDGEEKMFFLRDSWSWWKDGSAKFYAYFWNSSTGDDAWSGEASWVVQTTSENKDVWGYTVPEGTWDKVIITRGSAASFDDGKTWNKSNDITLEATTNLLTDWTVSGETEHAITWSNITLDGKTVYFDNRNYSTWTSAYVRIGKSDHNAAWGPMTKVGGTKYLYEKETDQYDFHTDLSVANSYGWTNDNNIYQPWENQSWSAPAKISKQTTYQKFGIQRDVYLCPTSTSMLERECQYYNVNGGTSTNTFDNVNTGTVLPQYTVTATGTNCTVSLVEYTADDFSASNDISSGDAVDPTRYVGVTVTPNSGYQFSSVSLTEDAYEQHTAAADGVTGKYAILADCEISASCTPETYTITYKDGGGADVPFSGYHIGTPPSTHTYNTATSLTKATKAGYVFGGWYTDYSYTSSAGSSLGKTAYTANITLYAKWTAMSLANLATGTFYGASKIVPKNVTVSSTEQYYPGVATGQLFNVLGTGTSDATTGPMSSKTISSQSLTNTSAVTECMYFKKAATVTSYVPTDHAIQFKLPSAGQLEVWANDDIYLSDGSSETLVDISGNYAVVKGLAAGTYYLYAKNTSRTLYGIRYKKTHTVTARTSTGKSTYGTVSASPTVVAEDSTSIITAVPATGYQVTNWAVSGTDASISPDGDSNNNTTTLTMGTAKATVTVTFGAIDYTITHSDPTGDGTYTISVAGGSAVSTNTTANYGQTITLAATPGEGYEFTSWTVTGATSGDAITVTSNQFAMPAENVTVTATFTATATYTVTYKANGGTGDDVVDDAATSVASNAFTAPTGKVFGGWNTESDGTGTPYAVGDAVSSDLTLYAQWKYKVLYLTTASTTGDDLYDALKDIYDVTVRAPRRAASFNYSDTALVVLHESINGDSAKADVATKEILQLRSANIPILNTKSYFYTYNSTASKGRWGWGTPNNGQTVKGAKLNTTYANIASHPIFDDLTITSDSIAIVGTAVAKAMQPILSFQSGYEGYTLATTSKNGDWTTRGTAIHELTAAQRSAATGASITAKYLMISVSSSKLNDLNEDGVKLFQNAADYLITGSQWVPQYAITKSATNGSIATEVSSSAVTSAAAGTRVDITATPSEGYVFSSWSVYKTGDAETTVSTNAETSPTYFTMPAYPVTVSATFALDGHTVTYADGGADSGDVPEDNTLYSEGDEVTVLDNIDLEKTEHSFGGWTANVDLTIDDATVTAGTTIDAGAEFEMPDEDVMLTAVWTPNTYDITYNLNSGSWASSAGASSYTYGVGYTLPTGADLTKTNYTFIGWYDNSSFTGSAITAIAADATGDKEYWAKWGTTRTIAWYVDGDEYSTGSPTTTTCEELGITTMPTAPSALSCSDVFRGWSATNLAGNATNTTPSDLFTIAGDAPTIDANKTLYAVFANNAAVDATSFTTTFTSKAWADDDSKWTSGKDGYAKSATQGVQISTGVTGANATTKAEYKAVSKVVVTYSTNSGSGAGSIEIKVGGTTVSGDADVTKTGGTDDRSINYIPASSLDGKVKITVNTTDGSIYIKSVQIFHSGSFVNYRCVCPSVTVTPKLVTSGTPIFITSAAEKTVRSQDTLHISGSGFASSTTLTLKNLSPKFVLKSATNGAISTDATGSIDTDAFIFYNPGATTEDGLDKNSSFTITDGKADVEVDQALIGRHLPANFVIAAKSGDAWYALPADMVNTTPTPVEITVDKATTPTTGTAIYDNAYSLYGQHNTSVSAGNGQYVKLAMRGQSNLPLFGSTSTTLGKGGTATNIENDLSDDYWWLFKQTNTSITNAADAKYIVYSANNTTNHLKLWMAAGGAGNPKWGLYANGIEEIRLIPWVEKVFSITYNLDSGTNPVGAPTGFTTRSEDIDLPTPTKDDYVFQGWYTDDEFTSDRVYIIPSGSTGDKTYYAKWGSEVSVVWDIDAVDDKLYKGGGGHTVTAIVDDASWTGSASSLVLGASDGVILGTTTTSTVDSKAQIEATFDITEDVEGDEIIFYLTAPANGSYGAIEDNEEVSLDACPSGGTTVTLTNFGNSKSKSNNKPSSLSKYFWAYAGTTMTSAYAYTITTGNTGTHNYDNDSTALTLKYGGVSNNGFMDIYADNTTTGGIPSTFSQITALSMKIKLKKTAPTLTISIGGTSVASATTLTGATTSSYEEFTFDGLNKLSGVIRIQNDGSSADNDLYLDDIAITYSSTSGIATSLTWSGGLADKGTVSGAGYSVGNADFSYTASVDKNSLGAITYSSSDPSVATVNAAGKVHMLKAGSTTIKAMIAESGCYNADTISYTLTVAAAACSDVAGTVTTENLGCEGIRLTVSGYTDGASIAWYKDGAAITPAETGTTYTATAAGEYYAVTTGSCSMASNSVIVEEAADNDINPVIFAAEFSVKDDRWFGYRLMQLEEGQSVSVKTSPTGWTEDYHYYITTDADNIVHIEGNVAVASDANKTLTLTVSNNCSGTKDVNFTIHELTATAKPTVAWIATGTKGDKTSVSADQSTNTALYKFLKDSFDITPRNCYWSDSEADLIKEYSQYDLIILTDYPNSKKGPNGDGASKSYTNAIGLLIDHKPILTFEAFVAGCPNWGIATNPTNTTTTQTDLTLLCNAKDIFKDNTSKFAAGADVAVTTASSGQALQGFPVAYAPDFVFIGKITDSDSKQYVACCERQAESAARMMIFGLNSAIMSNMTDDGKKMVDGFLDYLYIMDPAQIPDCSVIFTGEGGDANWNTEGNWESGSVPDDPYVSVRIDAPCVIPDSYVAKAGHVKIHVGVNDGFEAFNGSLTIAPTGELIVEKTVSRVEDNEYTVHKETQVGDIYLQSGASGTGALIMKSYRGGNDATVEFYSLGRKNGSGKKIYQYMGTPFDLSEVQYNYYGAWMYRWDVVNQTWIKMKNGNPASTFLGYCISNPTTADHYTYWMQGELVSTADKTLNMTYNGSRTENLLANSWTAPISINALNDGATFTNCEKTIYIFNAGSDAEYEAHASDAASATATSAGSYITLPISSTPYVGSELKVIPSMQAFSVYATGANPSLTLDYAKLVHEPAVAESAAIVGARAPRQSNAATDDPIVLRLRVNGDRFSDIVYMLEREDFTDGFDNGWDGRKMEGLDETPTLYAISTDGNMAVNCVPEMEGTMLGFKAGEDENYTFTFGYPEEEDDIYLLDVQTGIYTRIVDGNNYSFATSDKIADNRFILTRNAPGVATGVENAQGGDNLRDKALKFIYQDKMYIFIRGVLYDSGGRRVGEKMPYDDATEKGGAL